MSDVENPQGAVVGTQAADAVTTLNPAGAAAGVQSPQATFGLNPQGAVVGVQSRNARYVLNPAGAVIAYEPAALPPPRDVARRFLIPFAADGDRVDVPNPAQPDGKVSYRQGFGPDYAKPRSMPGRKPVPRRENNQILHDITDAIGEIQRYGVPDWADFQLMPDGYPRGALVHFEGVVYQSQIQGNTAQPGEGSAAWKPVGTGRAVNVPGEPSQNGVPESGGLTVTAQNEIMAMLSGGDPDGEYVDIPVQMAEIQFDIPTAPRNENRHESFTASGDGYHVPVASIHYVRGTDAFLLPPLFRPTMLSDSCILRFQYVGDRPLHTILRGSLEMLVRFGNFTGPAEPPQHGLVLFLRKYSTTPPQDNGEGSSFRLAGSASSGRVTQVGGRTDFSLLDVDNGDARPRMRTAWVADVVASGNLNTAPVLNAWFNTNDTELRAPTDPGGPSDPAQQANLKTTDWFDVDTSAGTIPARSFYFRVNDRANMAATEWTTRLRVQAKDAAGVVTYIHGGNGCSDDIILVPAGTVALRAYYCGPTDTAQTLQVYSCASVSSASLQPPGIPGSWYRHSLAVHEPVTFYPGSVYGLGIASVGATAAVGFSQHAFRVESGGLSCMADVTRYVKKHFDLRA